MEDRKSVFEYWHPVVLFVYFCGIIVISMLSQNLVVNGLAFLGSLFFLCLLEEQRSFVKRMLWSFIIVLVVTVTNPFFSHNGETPLFFVNDQAYTVEALIYGLHIGLMLMGVINWFSALSICMDNDKLMYLTSRLTPGLALMLSMSLRLVPMMRKKYSEMRETDAALGRAALGGKKPSVLEHLKIFLAVAGWTLEKVPKMTMSMNARGYKSGKRSTYSCFLFKRRSAITLSCILLIYGLLIFASYTQVITGYYYPKYYISFDMKNVIYYMITGCLFFYPAFREGVDRLTWNYLKSKI